MTTERLPAGVQRVLVAGSSGAGKTTMAAALGVVVVRPGSGRQADRWLAAQRDGGSGPR